MSDVSIVIFRSCYGQNRLWEFQYLTTRYYPHVRLDWHKTCHLYYGGDYGPSVIQRLPDILTPRQWSDIGAQCIGVKDVFQVLGEGETLADCVQSVGRLTDREILGLVPKTWSMQIKHLGKMRRLHPVERRTQIEQFREVLGVLRNRTVDLINPDTELCLLKDCRSLERLDAGTDRQATHYHWLLKRIPSNINGCAKELAKQSDVKKRAFISTTTMPSDRSLLMSNLGLVGQGMSVLDPFCGSGGLLLSSSLLGAQVIGADVDAELLLFKDTPLPFPHSPHRIGRGVERVSYVDSFLELGLDEPILLPGLDIQSDDFVNQVLEVNQGWRYDAIVTDPPYGIRESNSKMSDTEITARLCEVASQVLKRSGRVVFLRVVECTLETVEQTQQLLEKELNLIATQYCFDVLSVAMEKFNNRSWRATVVLSKNDKIVR